MKFIERLDVLEQGYTQYLAQQAQAKPTSKESLVDFACLIPRGEWFEIAEEYVAHMCPETGISYQFLQGMRHGVMGHVLSQVFAHLVRGHIQPTLHSLQELVDAVDLVIDHYKFTNKTLPPVLVYRELVTLWIRYRDTYQSLRESLAPESITELFDGVRQVHASAGLCDGPDQAALLDRETVLDYVDRLILSY